MARTLESFPDVSTFPGLKTNNDVRNAMLSGKVAEQAKDWAFLSPAIYARKWDNRVPEIDPLPAEQAESIANLGAEQGTEEVHFTGENLEDLVVDIPEDARPIPDPFSEEEWQPRDMKTTIITRENIDHFNNPFA
jgi:hypothetical protein